MKLIDPKSLMWGLTTLERLARSDAQQALLGRVYYIVNHYPRLEVVRLDKVKEILRSGVSLDTEADQDYVCELIDEAAKEGEA
jgi:hypothetical protein